MEKYEVCIKTSASKEIRSIDSKKNRIAIIKKIQTLADDPRQSGAIKLSHQDKYRVRQGNYRILYQILDKKIQVHVVKIAHRKHIYKNLP